MEIFHLFILQVRTIFSSKESTFIIILIKNRVFIPIITLENKFNFHTKSSCLYHASGCKFSVLFWHFVFRLTGSMRHLCPMHATLSVWHLSRQHCRHILWSHFKPYITSEMWKVFDKYISLALLCKSPTVGLAHFIAQHRSNECVRRWRILSLFCFWFARLRRFMTFFEIFFPSSSK